MHVVENVKYDPILTANSPKKKRIPVFPHKALEFQTNYHMQSIFDLACPPPNNSLMTNLKSFLSKVSSIYFKKHLPMANG